MLEFRAHNPRVMVTLQFSNDWLWWLMNWFVYIFVMSLYRDARGHSNFASCLGDTPYFG